MSLLEAVMCKYCGEPGCGDHMARGFLKAGTAQQKKRTKAWNKAQDAIAKLAKQRKK
jgi:hypothetical protein